MLRDHHVVGPEHAALVRHHELEVRVVGQQLHHVARPHHRGREVAVGQMVRVVVAVEGADLLVVDVGLDRVVGLLCVGGGALGWVDPQVQHHQAERVAHLGQQADLALELGIPEVADGGQVTAGQLAVVADAGETGLPGHEELVVGVDRAAVVGGQQVRLDVGQDVPLERLDVAELHPLAGHPVGQRDHVAADVLAGLQRRLELPEELLVVVDVLDVVGMGLVLGVEHVDRGVAVVLLVDVERPVRPVPVRGDRVRVLDRSRRRSSGSGCWRHPPHRRRRPAGWRRPASLRQAPTRRMKSRRVRAPRAKARASMSARERRGSVVIVAPPGSVLLGYR